MTTVETQTLESPRLTALLCELEAGNGDALAAFWHEMEVNGAPLIEKPEGTEEYLVTFLWRSAEPLDNVVAVTPWLSLDLTKNYMHRLQGTDIWYRSYRGTGSLRGSYRLAPNHPPIPYDQI